MTSINELYEARYKFASGNIAKGAPVVALVYKDGVLVLTTNSNPSFHKVRELHHRIVFAGMGNRYIELNDLHRILNESVVHDSTLFSDEDVSAVFLAEKAASIVSAAFRNVRAWPFESEFLIGEISDEKEGIISIFHIAFDGGVEERSDFVCLAGNEAKNKIENFLKENYETNLSFDEALNLAKKALSIIDDRGNSGIVWEGAVLDRTQKGFTKFRRFSQEEVEECPKNE